MKARGISASALARILETHPSAVSRWLKGPARPDPHLWIALERILGIPFCEWVTRREWQQVDAAVTRASSTVAREAA